MDTLSPATQEERNFIPSYENRPPPPLPPLPDRTLSALLVNNPAKQAVIADQFPTLLEKSKEELNDLAHNDVLFESFFEELDRVKNMRALRDEMRMANETLAKKTLAREQEIIRFRQSIQEQERAFKILHEEFYEKLKVQQNVLHRFSPDLLLSKLKSDTQLSDEVSEQMATSFLEGESENDLFLKHFREVRKVYHLRNAKLERVSREPGIFGL
ncbi:hypothetical protein G9A89_021154 [Geosiphon pyriformis]|nr:hypothetical protein G9A89_021154 [Geosiphon pyriformis]